MAQQRKSPPKALTARQEKFCLLLAGDAALSKAEAYRTAGYSPGKSHQDTAERAQKLLAYPKIQARLTELRQDAADTRIWTRNGTLQMLRDVAATALDNIYKRQLETDEDGNVREVITGYNASAATVALKAAEQASKMCGYDAPTQVHNRIIISMQQDELDDFAE